MHRTVLAALFVSAGSMAQSGSGSIAGHAVAADGRTLRAMVMLLPAAAPLLPTAPAMPPPAVRRVPTDRNGAFQFAQVPSGKYSLCAQPVEGQGQKPNEYFVDSCEWRSFQVSVQLNAGQVITGLAVTAPQGTLLRVHVNDPAGALAAANAPSQASPPRFDPKLLLVVKSPDHLVHPIPITSRSSQGRDLAVVIPFGVSLALSVNSPTFTVLDSAGRPFSADTSVQAAAGTALAQINLTVSGVRP